jgi:hypothetical protein
MGAAMTAAVLGFSPAGASIPALHTQVQEFFVVHPQNSQSNFEKPSIRGHVGRAGTAG